MKKSREEQLLEFAQQIISLNSHIQIGLTGSLMLHHRGVYLGRDIQDLDFVCSKIKEDDGGKFDLLNLPEGCRKNRPSYPDSASYMLKLDDGTEVKVDFLLSSEPITPINGVPLGDVLNLLMAKHKYSLRDLNEDSRAKHKMDIEIIIQETDPDGKLGYQVKLDELTAKYKQQKQDVDGLFDIFE